MNELTAIHAARLIAQRQLTSERLTRACLERIEEREPAVEAWEYLDPDLALAQARLADLSPIRGPLHGVPLAIKDVIDTVDMPTAYGSRVYSRYRPASDATCVALARASGAIILGKTVATEFAGVAPGKTRNPHNPLCTPGGSSSGSAAAVGCAMVPLALGTQTYGSTIRPASFCGVVGYKPNYGKAEVTGIKTLASGLDTLGLFARNVPDVALLAWVVTGGRVVGTVDTSSAPHIGLLNTSPWGELADATRNLLDESVRRLSACGAQVYDLSSPSSMALWREILDVVFVWEALQALAFERIFRRNDVEPRTQQMFEEYEQRLTSESYERALQLAHKERRQCADLFRNCDVVLVPAAVGEAPEGLGHTGDARFNGPWSVLHLPCLTLPMGRGPAGLPIGLQLVAGPGDDAKLLRAASFVEACLAA